MRLTCTAARRLLQAFHDGELEVGGQIAVSAHVETCRTCADALADVRMVSRVLRVAAGRAPLSNEEAAGFQAGVVTRLKTERESSLMTRARGMFEDMHLVYAGLGGVMAMVLSVVTMFGMLRSATDERPDSLAAVVALLATPGSSAGIAPIDVASHARWTARFWAANEAAEQDAVFALAATLTRDEEKAAGPLHVRVDQTKEERKLIEELLDTVARARLGPKQAEGLPAVANMVVWLVTRTTVRASQNPGAASLAPPAAKKRA